MSLDKCSNGARMLIREILGNLLHHQVLDLTDRPSGFRRKGIIPSVKDQNSGAISADHPLAGRKPRRYETNLDVKCDTRMV